jgi:hypothetical protein
MDKWNLIAGLYAGYVFVTVFIQMISEGTYLPMNELSGLVWFLSMFLPLPVTYFILIMKSDTKSKRKKT